MTTSTSPPDAATPPPLSHESVGLGPAGRHALAQLGDALRRSGDTEWRAPLLAGEAIDRGTLEGHLAADDVAALVVSGLAVVEDGSIRLAVTIIEVGDVLVAIPTQGWGPDVVYLGPDSAHLAEAVRRLAPSGERAIELGAGTGVLVALLAARYRTTWATDISPSVALASAVTVGLNRYPPGHVVGLCVSDVAAAHRPGSFDLVATNSPWVPSVEAGAGHEHAPELFADGGPTGIEIPRRFLLEGPPLLRPGGMALTLALDAELADGRQPLREATDGLADDGYLVRVLATPYNGERTNLTGAVRHRQPDIRRATHVLVVVVRRRAPDDERRSLMVAVDALEARWARRLA